MYIWWHYTRYGLLYNNLFMTLNHPHTRAPLLHPLSRETVLGPSILQWPNVKKNMMNTPRLKNNWSMARPEDLVFLPA